MGQGLKVEKLALGGRALDNMSKGTGIEGRTSGAALREGEEC